MRASRRQGDPKLGVAYLRASKDEQKLSPEAQREAIEVWAAREGVRIVAWFVDQGVCSVDAIEDRPNLIAALGELRASGAGLLVVAKRDRLARDVYIAGAIERAVAQSGARVAAADGTANGDTPAEKFMRAMLDAAAAYERDLIRARTKAALAAKKRRGEYTGGGAPYGYRVIPSDAPVRAGEEPVLVTVPHPEERDVIELARALAAGGLSLRAVSRELAERGHRSRVGTPFEAKQIQRMLAA